MDTQQKSRLQSLMTAELDPVSPTQIIVHYLAEI